MNKMDNPFYEHLIDNDNSEQIELFPNPADNGFEVHFNGLEPAKVEIRIFNTIGKLMFTEVYNLKQQQIEISTKNFENGVYFVNLIIEQNEEVNKRLVIVK